MRSRVWASEMWFQKGDPTAPVLTNWELPWRKYGGDNPTTIYLSAPVSPNLRYRLRGPIGDAVYAGLQVNTKGPGFNAPSANVSDDRLLRGGHEIDLLIGGADPGDGTPWIFAIRCLLPERRELPAAEVIIV